MSTCEVLTGWNSHDGRTLVPVAESWADRWPCGEPAAVTLQIGCIHEHLAERQACSVHASPAEHDAVAMCRACAELGHDCPVTITIIVSP